MVLSIVVGQFHMDTVITSVTRNQVPSPKPWHPVSLEFRRGASDPCVLVLSSEPYLLMAMLQVFVDFLHLTRVFALVSDKVV